MEIEEARPALAKRESPFVKGSAYDLGLCEQKVQCPYRGCKVERSAMFDHLTKCPVATEHGKRYGESEVPSAVKALLKKIGSFIHQP